MLTQKAFPDTRFPQLCRSFLKSFPTVFSIFLATLLIHTPIFAEKKSPEAKTNRPKIGLVLAGGGALGIAHVGVLQVLEENKIPIDVITGTSMGAIVGAAYAAGVSVDEMIKVLTKTDWDSMFKEAPDRDKVVYRLKAGREREIFGDAKLGFKDGKIATPAGFIQGQKILPLLQKLYGNVPSPHNFDDLPIPFRAVTADIETGKAYIPSKGNLSRIVRASMSVPGAFTPVEIDGKLLVDGGIANNLPVNVAQEMGADILIVVELYADLAKREDLNGPFAISGQIISLLLAQNAEYQRGLMQKSDILITPNLSGFTPMDFNKGKKLLKLGKTAAKEQLKLLQSLSVDEASYARFQKNRQPHIDEQKIEFVKIENTSRLPDAIIKKQVKTKAGSKLDRQTIEDDISRIYSTGYFSDVSYDYTEEKGEKGVFISAKGKDWLEEYLRMGMSIEDDFSGNTFFAVAGNYHLNGVNAWGAELDTQLQLGTTPRAFVEFYQPLGEGVPYFVAPQAQYSQTNVLARVNNDIIAEYDREDMNAGLAIGRELGSLGEFRFLYMGGNGEFTRSIGSPTLPESKYEYGDLTTGFALDTLDTPDFPTDGFLLSTDYTAVLKELGPDYNFEQLTGAMAYPMTWGRNTVSLVGNFGHTFGPRPLDRTFISGGFFNLSGYARNSITSSDYTIGRLLYYRDLSNVKSPLFGLSLFAGGSAEIGHFQSDSDLIGDQGAIAAGSVFIGVDTPITPLYFGVGAAEEGEVAGYMAIGRVNARRR